MRNIQPVLKLLFLFGLSLTATACGSLPFSHLSFKRFAVSAPAPVMRSHACIVLEILRDVWRPGPPHSLGCAAIEPN
jgi:hypothetical protein